MKCKKACQTKWNPFIAANVLSEHLLLANDVVLVLFICQYFCGISNQIYVRFYSHYSCYDFSK